MGNMDETRGHEDSNMRIKGMIETSKDRAEVKGHENFNTKDVAASEAQMNWAENNMGPLAMSLDPGKGWISEELGLGSRHWKRLARKNKETSPSEKFGLADVKRGPVPLLELDPNTLCTKKGKGKGVEKNPLCEENNVDGGVAVAVRQHCQTQ